MKPGWLALLAATFATKATTAPPPASPWLAVVTRVRVVVMREAVVTTEEVTFDRGDWTSGDVDVYVAFAAPGAPRAFEAHLVSHDDASFFAPDDPGELVTSDRATKKPDRALTLLGSSHMAGEVVHLREPALRRAFASSRRATLRVRMLGQLPAADAAGNREVLVRLGAPAGVPLALASIDVASGDALTKLDHASAQLCGPDADPYPLYVALRGGPSDPRAASPLLVTRHAQDDLCVRVHVAP